METEDTGSATKVSEMCGQRVSATDEGGSIRESWMMTKSPVVYAPLTLTWYKSFVFIVPAASEYK